MTGSPRFVYFAEREGLIKIGVSRSPVRRAAALGARLLARTPGDHVSERAMHMRFAHHYAGGEWFRPGPDLLALVSELAPPPPPPSPPRSMTTTAPALTCSLAEAADLLGVHVTTLRRRIYATRTETYAGEIAPGVPVIRFGPRLTWVSRTALEAYIASGGKVSA